MTVGNRITDMTPLAAGALPTGAVAPVVADGTNYEFAIKDEFARYPTSAALALGSGAAAIGASYSGFPAIITTLGDALPFLNHGNFFGISSNGVADDTAELQAALLTLSNAGGGRLRLKPGAVTIVANELIIYDNVQLDLAGGTLRCNLAGGNMPGLRLRNYALVEHGWIDVVSTGSPGSQTGIHAPILIGALGDENPLHTNISANEGVRGWIVRNLKLSSNKDLGALASPRGAVGIQVVGGACHGLIQDVEIGGNLAGAFVMANPDMAGGVHLDWGYVGPISTADTNVAQSANKAAFQAATKTRWTTHPHHIAIHGLTVGALTQSGASFDQGSHGVRMSGAYNVRVEGFEIDQTTQAAIKVAGGDLGFEFALDADRRHACQSIRIAGGIVRDAGVGFGIQLDSYGDNVARAVLDGYASISSPLWESDILVEQVHVRSTVGGSDGIRFENVDGARAFRCSAQGFARGAAIDDNARNVTVSRGRYVNNDGEGISCFHTTNAPQDIVIEANAVHSNGEALGAGGKQRAGIYINRCTRVRVSDNTLGLPGQYDPSQLNGIEVAQTATITDLQISGNLVHSTTAPGTAYAIMAAADYGKLRIYENNQADASKTGTVFAGVSARPFHRRQGQHGEVVHYDINRGTTPTALVVNKDDVLFYSDTAAGGSMGLYVTTAGAIGSTAVTKALPSIAA